MESERERETQSLNHLSIRQWVPFAIHHDHSPGPPAQRAQRAQGLRRTGDLPGILQKKWIGTEIPRFLFPRLYSLPSGKHSYWRWAIEIVDLPSNSMVIFLSKIPEGIMTSSCSKSLANLHCGQPGGPGLLTQQLVPLGWNKQVSFWTLLFGL